MKLAALCVEAFWRHHLLVAGHPPGMTLMHFVFPDNPSLLLEENVRSACLGQVGVICARCCQTTSKHSVTFKELKKDFYLHAKFNLGTKSFKVSPLLPSTSYLQKQSLNRR